MTNVVLVNATQLYITDSPVVYVSESKIQNWCLSDHQSYASAELGTNIVYVRRTHSWHRAAPQS